MSDYVLVDTSVWVTYLRKGDDRLAAMLNNNLVMIHPFVIGELACGTMKNRTEILRLLHDLPEVEMAELPEVLTLIESHQLMGQGLGLIDMFLLSSCLLSGVLLWTLDKSLAAAAERLGVVFSLNRPL